MRHLAIAGLLFAATGALAQGKPTAPLVLRLPSSTRGLAMGNVAVASGNDDVIFYNPAQLAIARAASLSVQRFSEGAIAGALSAAMAFNNGGIGIGAQWVSFDAPTQTPFAPTNLTQRGGVPAASAAAALGMAQVFKGVRIGAAAKVAQEIAGSERSMTVLGDIGAGKDFRGFVNVGLAVRNLGASNTSLTGVSVPPPSRATLGVQASRPIANLSSSLSPFIDIATAMEVSVLRDGWVKPAAGLELVYNWIEGYSFILRGGVRRPELGERQTTLGAGLVADRLRVEYALEPREGGSVSHRFGIRVR